MSTTMFSIEIKNLPNDHLIGFLPNVTLEELNGCLTAFAVMQQMEPLENIDNLTVRDHTGNILSVDDLKSIWSGKYLPGSVMVDFDDNIHVSGSLTKTNKRYKKYLIIQPHIMTFGHVGFLVAYDNSKFMDCFNQACAYMKQFDPKNTRKLIDYYGDYLTFKTEFAKFHEILW